MKLLIALILLLVLPFTVRADNGFYAYALHGTNPATPCITMGWNNNGSGGTILNYNCKTGTYYQGFVTAVVVTGPNSGIILSRGLVNGSILADGVDVFGAGQVNTPSAVDAVTGAELLNADGDMTGPVFYGSEYAWIAGSI